MKKIIFSILLVSVALMGAEETFYRAGMMMPIDGPALYKKYCVSCHGEKGEESAFGKSAAIGGKDAAKIASDLKEYRFGSLDKYGLGALMKSRTVRFSWDEIDAVAAYIQTLK
jgi:cytochrome c553